jgi:hypothetical protein
MKSEVSGWERRVIMAERLLLGNGEFSGKMKGNNSLSPPMRDQHDDYLLTS